jgi:hypothetical protein
MRFSMRVAGSPAPPTTRSMAPRLSRPQRPLRRQGVGPEAAKAVDGGGAQRGHARRMGQQAGQPVGAGIGQRVAGVARGAALGGLARTKALRPSVPLDQRLVQVPAAGHDVRERRAAHEGGVVAGAAQRLAHAVAEQHHLVGGGQRVGGVEHGLDLAGAQFDLQRLQRQAQRLRGVHHDAQRLVGHVDHGFGLQVVAGVDHAHRRRQAGPGRLHRVELRRTRR